MGAALPLITGAVGQGAAGLMQGQREADMHKQLMQMMGMQQAREGREAGLYPGQLALQQGQVQQQQAQQQFEGARLGAMQRAGQPSPLMAHILGGMPEFKGLEPQLAQLPSSSLDPLAKVVADLEKARMARIAMMWHTPEMQFGKQEIDALNKQAQEQEAAADKLDMERTSKKLDMSSDAGASNITAATMARSKAKKLRDLAQQKSESFMHSHGASPHQVYNAYRISAPLGAPEAEEENAP